MQTALHIYSLVRHLQDFTIDARLAGTAFYKKEREAYIFFETADRSLALGLIYHPISFGALLLPRSAIKISSTEKPWPFFQPAHGAIVRSIEQVGFDRIIRIMLSKGEEIFSIILEAIGPNGNFWLLDSKDKILATLRHKKYETSTAYIPPPGQGKLNPFELSEKELVNALKKEPHNTFLEAALKKNIAGLDDGLIGEIIERARITAGLKTESLEDEKISRMRTAIKDVAAQFREYRPGRLYISSSRLSAYPFKLQFSSENPSEYDSLSAAVYEAILLKRKRKEECAEKERITEGIARAIAKQEKKIYKIEKDLKSSGKFDEYRKFAELLKINLSALKKGMTRAVVADIYRAGEHFLEIPLNPALTPSENADDYFKKYRKGKEALELLERRLDVARQELDSLKKIKEELERDHDSALNRYRSEIAAILPSASARREQATRLPYKIFSLSTGVTIFVGRDGTDNDETTFHHAKPHELWFHAAQCPGSHVVMKFPNKDFKPSRAEILETAAIAAYFSKAKNSKTVPVIYTERRYVRKPRKAKPGLVTVEREKLVMAEPKKPTEK
jgi:predicted ribosome quality control (RQC) complex YloA/Tae2 family protein